MRPKSFIITTVFFVVLCSASLVKLQSQALPILTCNQLDSITAITMDSSLFFRKDIIESLYNTYDDQSKKNCVSYPRLLSIIGFHKFISNDIVASRASLLQADSIYTSTNFLKHKYSIRNLIFLGINYNSANDSLKSVQYLSRAVDQCRATDNEYLLSDALHNLAVVHSKSKNNSEALKLVEKAIQHAEVSNNLEVVGFANLTLSQLYMDDGKLEQAEKAVRTSSNVFQKLNFGTHMYLVYFHQARLAHLHEDFVETERLYLKALTAGTDTDHIHLHGIINTQLGKINESLNNTKKAAHYYEKVLNYPLIISDVDYDKAISFLTNYYIDNRKPSKLGDIINQLNTTREKKKEQLRAELHLLNQREIELLNEKKEKAIIANKSRTQQTILLILLLAVLISSLLAIYALMQWRRNKSLNEQVEVQNARLQNQNIELNNFAATAAHDLKAPARSISSFASLIERKLPKNLDESISKYLGIIKISAVSMSNLVDGLRLFSDLGNRTLSLKTINTRQLVQEVIDSLYSTIDLTGANIEINENLPEHIRGDETLLKIVFQNLLNNGMKFVADGVKPQIDISYRSSGGNHVFDIRDNGIGIEDKYLEKIFLIFERLHSSSDYEGSGIGLATCKKIMLAHKGDITIKSKPDQGSVFSIIIPQRIDK